MLTNNGYSLTYYKNRNQIVIELPQTFKTLTNTLNPVVGRRVDIEEKELAILLTVAQAIFLDGAKMDEVLNVPLRNGKSMMELERLMDEVEDEVTDD